MRIPASNSDARLRSNTPSAREIHGFDLSRRRSRSKLFLSVLLSGLLLPPQAFGARCEAGSGNARTALLELYSSEGCNSCPPADAWLSTLQAKGLAPMRIVPLAFHVDYWDNLGWRDPFANAQFTARQHAAAERTRAEFVYTPQFLFNGQVFRPSDRDDALRASLTSIARAPTPVSIHITHEKIAGRTLKLRANASWTDTPVASSQLFVALFESKLQSSVRAGENNGRRLQHDYIVRSFAGPFDVTAADPLPIDLTLALDNQWTQANVGVAAFIQRKDSGEVLQAMATPLCN